MPFITFDPIVMPVAGTGGSDNYNVLSIDFGDNYSQRMPNGLNSVFEEIDLQWEHLSFAELSSLRAFFKSVKGVTPFLFKLPVETELKTFVNSSALNWVSEPGGFTYSASITLREVFDRA